MCSTFRFALLLVVGVFILIVVPDIGAVVSAEPAYGTAVVDGDPSEWDLTNDYFADMYKAAKPAQGTLSKLYMKYDCATQTAYVMVAAEPGYVLDLNDPIGDDYVKIDDVKLVDGGIGDDGIPPDFAYIPSGTDKVGWEASFLLAPGSYMLNVHTQIDPGETSAVEGRDIPLTINCDLGSIGDYVWFDESGLGDQDENPLTHGLDNVRVRLFKETGTNTFTEVGETTTNAIGFYLFSGLPAGDYMVDVHDPDIGPHFSNGWISTTNNDPYPVGGTYPLAAGEHHRDADFGYDDLGDLVALGDWVWFDESHLGDQDEPPHYGLACVTVWLYDWTSTGPDDWIARTNTDSWGYYYFGGMPASPGPGFNYATAVDTSDPDIDSYIDFLNGSPVTPTCDRVGEVLPAATVSLMQPMAELSPSGSSGTDEMTGSDVPGTTDLTLDYAFWKNPLAISLAGFEAAEASSTPVGKWVVAAAVIAFLGTGAWLLSRRQEVK